MLHCATQVALYDIEMTLGKRIKAARERLPKKMTQQALADEFGITDKAVSAWERDVDTPGLDKLPKLRKVLRVTYAWLVEGGGPPPAVDDPQVTLEDLAQNERAAIRIGLDAMLASLRQHPDRVA